MNREFLKKIEDVVLATILVVGILMIVMHWK